MEDLKEKTEKVLQMMQQLPDNEGSKWQEDLRVAVTGIVEKRQLPKKNPRPELNVEDDLYADF